MGLSLGGRCSSNNVPRKGWSTLLTAILTLVRTHGNDCVSHSVARGGPPPEGAPWRSSASPTTPSSPTPRLSSSGTGSRPVIFSPDSGRNPSITMYAFKFTVHSFHMDFPHSFIIPFYTPNASNPHLIQPQHPLNNGKKFLVEYAEITTNINLRIKNIIETIKKTRILSNQLKQNLSTRKPSPPQSKWASTVSEKIPSSIGRLFACTWPNHLLDPAWARYV